MVSFPPIWLFIRGIVPVHHFTEMAMELILLVLSPLVIALVFFLGFRVSEKEVAGNGTRLSTSLREHSEDGLSLATSYLSCTHTPQLPWVLSWTNILTSLYFLLFYTKYYPSPDFK